MTYRKYIFKTFNTMACHTLLTFKSHVENSLTELDEILNYTFFQ